MEYTESLQAPPGPHEAGRLLQSLAWIAQVSLTLAWPGRTESLPAICRPTWPLANADPNRSDKYGYTSLSYAAEMGHVGAVKLLQARVSVEKADTRRLHVLWKT